VIGWVKVDCECQVISIAFGWYGLLAAVRMVMDDLSPNVVADAQTRLAMAKSVADLVAGVARHNGGLDVTRLKRIAIIGAAPEGERLARICKQHGIAIIAIVDDDPEKLGRKIGDTTVEASATLDGMDRSVPIVIASHRVLGATQKLRAKGFSTVLPFAALQILAPSVFPPHMFYVGWLTDVWEHRDQYRWLGGALGDDRSRQVLNAVLNYRMSADPEFLAPVLDKGRHHQGLYHPTGLFECDEHEVYIDAGAFDGDSLTWFKERVANQYDRIIAFEPDPKTYASLTKNFIGDDRIQTINAGLHRKKALLRFRDDASRGAIFTEDGEISMNVVALDELLAGERATFIKMNIEGAEIDALYGAQHTIRRWLPKLAISVYHRPTDLWRIPQLVREFSDKYELFLRQHDGGVIETVLYATAQPRKRMAA
jgi:FkbM family methyltransferase